MSLLDSGNVAYLGPSDVLKYLNNRWLELTDAVERALTSFSAGEVVQPVRSNVSVAPHNGMLLTMPAYSSTEDALATKLVTLYPQNKKFGLPTVQAVILVFNASTGALQSVMDGEVITNMRTAAASLVATKLLARSNSKVLALLGAGEQARSHYQAFSSFYNFEKIKVWNINQESALKLVKEIQEAGFTAEYHDTVQNAVQDADIIVTATMAEKPFLEKQWVKAGAHINAVGAPRPMWQELSNELMQSSVVYVDSREGALKESGDIILSKADIYAEIGEVILGKKEAFPGKTTVFKSLGMAVEDVVTAKLVLDLHIKFQNT